VADARQRYIYCRYGGEEFLLVLPQMSTDDAVERAEQLRSAIAAAPVSYAAPIGASNYGSLLRGCGDRH
jgi:diguanylate cyclase (GGDEF)-like protein